MSNKVKMYGVDKIRYALDRIVWAETQFQIWKNSYIRSGLISYIPRLKLKYKLEGLINHDRVLHDRKQY